MGSASSWQMFVLSTKSHHATGCPRQGKRSLPGSSGDTPGTPAQSCLLFVSSKTPVTSMKRSLTAMESTDGPLGLSERNLSPLQGAATFPAWLLSETASRVMQMWQAGSPKWQQEVVARLCGRWARARVFLRACWTQQAKSRQSPPREHTPTCRRKAAPCTWSLLSRMVRVDKLRFLALILKDLCLCLSFMPGERSPPWPPASRLPTASSAWGQVAAGPGSPSGSPALRA